MTTEERSELEGDPIVLIERKLDELYDFLVDRSAESAQLERRVEACEEAVAGNLQIIEEIIVLARGRRAQVDR